MTEAEARAAGWFRFTQVKQFVPDGQLLYRSSAPNYQKLPSGDHDASQNLTEEAINFLVDSGINSIISFNKYSYKPGQVTALENANIEYEHYPIYDGSAPTLDQLDKARKNFFEKGKSTLVHAGYGLGRTATGVTALQIATVFGQTLEPYASTWWGAEGNQVEKRGQISVLAEFRNELLQSKIKDVADIDPKKSFAIINAASGYYLTISQDNLTLVAHSPETVEHGPRTRPQYLWKIEKDANEFTLMNRVTYESFAIVKAGDSRVNNGRKEDGNNVFEIDAPSPDSGLYSISSTESGNPVVGIKEPDDNLKRLYYTKQTDALLFIDKTKIGKYGQWILVPILNAPGVGR